MNLIHKQSGMTLFIALIFLLIMTLFAVSSINMSTVNMRVIGNMQASKYMDAAAQDAIEQMLSTTAIYNVSPVASTITTTLAGIPFVVTINVPTCIDSKTATGYSAVVTNIIPQDNTWELVTTVTDPVTGASSTMHQGVGMRMLAGNCPEPP